MEADEIVYRAVLARERAGHYSSSLEAMIDVLESMDEPAAVETATTIMQWWSCHGMQMHDFLTEAEAPMSVGIFAALMPDAALLMGEVAGNA